MRAAPMFPFEMENLELGLNLGPSDQLFQDDLFNLALPDDQEQPLIDKDIHDIDHVLAQKKKSQEADSNHDLLQMVMDEVKMSPLTPSNTTSFVRVSR